MKKKLLALAIVSVALTAKAVDVLDYEHYFSDDPSFPFYPMGYTPEIINGILTAENPGGWYQFFIADGIPTTPGTDYKAVVKMKSSIAGSCALNMGWGWGDGETVNSTINFTTEWSECTVNYAGINGTSCNLVLQPGVFAGKIEIEWVKVYHDGEGIPTEGDLIASWYTGNGQTLGGWGATNMDQGDEDNKPCLIVTNDEAKEGDWQTQISIPHDYFDYGTTYYLGFDVKGSAGTTLRGINVNYQAESDYKSRGNLTKFNITPEWNHVIVYGECVEAPSGENDDPATNKANKILINLGKLAGTAYFTNVTLYTKSNLSDSVIANNAEIENHWTVYTMTGAKVMDTSDKSNLNNLRPGLYIVNGKKIVIR